MLLKAAQQTRLRSVQPIRGVRRAHVCCGVSVDQPWPGLLPPSCPGRVCYGVLAWSLQIESYASVLIPRPYIHRYACENLMPS